MTRLRFASLLLILAVVASACGSGSGGGESAEAAEPAEAASEVPAADEPAEEAGNDSQNSPRIESDSPIENLLGVPVFDDAAMTTLFTDLGREAEVVVATCMLGQGFEYTPAIIGGSGPGSELATDSLAYAEQRGLGIVADFNEAEYNPGTGTPNKNAEYIRSLSDGERDAYFIALTGAVEGADRAPDADTGCTGQAQEEVFSILGVFDAIETDLNRYYDLYISDSRILDTTKQWQTCMADEGYSFETEDELYEHIIVQVEEIMSDPSNFGEFDEEELMTSGGFFGGGFRPPLVPDAQAQVDSIGEEEKLVAVANWTCREPIKDIELEVQREYESDFVAEVGPQVRAIQGEG